MNIHTFEVHLGMPFRGSRFETVDAQVSLAGVALYHYNVRRELSASSAPGWRADVEDEIMRRFAQKLAEALDAVHEHEYDAG